MKTFYEKLQENLKAGQKEGEKKEVKFQIKGGNGSPAGFGISISSVDKTTYANFIEEKDYMKDAISVATVQIGMKDPSQKEKLEELFNQYRSKIDEFPLLQPFIADKKVEYFLRFTGNKACIDVVFKDQTAFEKLKEIGVDISEFHTFKFLFRTDLKPAEVLGEGELKEKAIKACSLVLSVEASATNAKFLITALKKTLEEMDLKDEKQKKRRKKLCLGLNGALAFINCNLNVEFNPTEFINTIFATKKATEKSEEVEGALALASTTIEGFGGETSKGMLEGFGVYEQAKTIDIDEISISLLSTQYKNGYAFQIFLPGVTQFLNEKFLSA